MKRLNELNPITAFLYFLLTVGAVTFSTESVLTLISLFGSILFFLVRNGLENKKSHLYAFLFFIVSALANPLFNHMGQTPLIVINDNPITKEASFYGLCMAGVLVSVIYWFRSFSQIMTSDKLIYIFGVISPKFSLLLSTALRYIPLFSRQSRKVKLTQKAMGLYKDGNLWDRFKGELRVFSVMMTWALENGIVTADSMAARGYSEKKRVSFSFYRFRVNDFIVLAVSLALFVITSFGKAFSVVDTQFYPVIVQSRLTPAGFAVYLSYFLLAVMPSVFEVKEELKWKYLTSKI